MQDYLEKGMEATSQVEVGAALQVYFNLNSLPQVCTLSRLPLVLNAVLSNTNHHHNLKAGPLTFVKIPYHGGTLRV